MERMQHVVICGQSIFLLAIEAGLAALPEVEVVRVDSHLPGVVDRIAALEPDVVVVERAGGEAELALELLGRGLPVMEIDAAEGTLTILHGHRVPARGAEDLAHAVSSIAAVEQIAVIDQIATRNR
jgi:ABC-type Fe3+-hydroxamate transport system substrate-binding protein